MNFKTELSLDAIPEDLTKDAEGEQLADDMDSFINTLRPIAMAMIKAAGEHGKKNNIGPRESAAGLAMAGLHLFRIINQKDPTVADRTYEVLVDLLIYATSCERKEEH